MMFNMTQSAFRNYVIGVDTKIPLRNGKWVTSINFDNAATTRSSRPGMVRISFGLYNDLNEINVLIQTLAHIAEYKDCYIQRYII